MSLEDLRRVVEELAERLPGGRIQEIRQPGPAAINLSLRIPGETLQLRLDATPGLAWVGLAPERGGTTTPTPRFLARLRHDLRGAAIRAVEVPWDDRVLVLRLGTGGGDAALILELTGHHSNLFLTGPDECIRDQLSPSRSHQRELVPGRSYAPPIPRPPAAGGSGRIPEDARSPAAAAAALYIAAAAKASEDKARRVLLADLRRASKRTIRTLGKVDRDLARAEEGLAARGPADLLKSRLYEVRKGMESVELEDWAEPGRRVIVPLDPRLEPAENLENLYARYKKARRSVDRIRERRAELAARVDELEGLLVEVREARGPLPDLKLRSRQATPAERGPRRPYHVFRSRTGRRILVGRSAADNRRLTFQVARGHDAWMHVRGVPGSHVVIPLARGQEPDSETLLDAAHLAIRYSRASGEAAAEISWTLRKYVRPAPGDKPGAVFVSREHTITVRVEPARLTRLKSTRE